MFLGKEILTYKNDVKVFHVGSVLVDGRAGVVSFFV